MSGKRYTRAELIEALRELAERVGRTPIEADTYKFSDIPCHVTYAQRFGSWREALVTAGLPLDAPYWGYDRATLLARLRDVVDALGRAPTGPEMREAGGPDPATYATHFGSWSAALGELGLEARGNRQYDSEELLQILRDLAEELGRAPTIAELRARQDLPSPYTIRDRFGRWSEALRLAGLNPGHTLQRRDRSPGPGLGGGGDGEREPAHRR